MAKPELKSTFVGLEKPGSFQCFWKADIRVEAFGPGRLTPNGSDASRSLFPELQRYQGDRQLVLVIKRAIIEL
jgi:hypothetical protein